MSSRLSSTFPSHRVALPTGVELDYVEFGDPRGMALIFLHGFADSWTSWTSILPALSPTYRSIAVTQRGHGDSTKPVCCYRLTDFAADVIAFMNALAIPQATLIGHSMGSAVAQRVAFDAPTRVTNLVLLGWGPSTPTTPAAVARLTALNNDMQTRDDALDPAFVRDFVAGSTVNPLPASMVDAMTVESLKMPLGVWKQILASRLSGDEQSMHGPCVVPTLVLYGEHDAYIQEGYEQLPQVHQQATFITYPAAGHVLHWDGPERFITDLHAFLS